MLLLFIQPDYSLCSVFNSLACQNMCYLFNLTAVTASLLFLAICCCLHAVSISATKSMEQDIFCI